MNTDTNAETLGNAKTRCACHAYEIESWKGDVPPDGDPGDYVKYEGTNCTQYTERIFAPGHDAKLKSLLIQAGASGLAVVQHDGGMATTSSAETVAKSYGFELQVLAGIKRAQAKAMERAEKKAAKAQKAMAAQTSKEIAKRAAQDAKAKKDTPAEPPFLVKVGRWTYPAVLDQKGNATYKTKSGQTRSAKKGSYELVEPTA